MNRVRALANVIVFATAALYAGEVKPSSVRLRDTVEVHSQRIVLADLLAWADAPAREVAAGIELGRAPQPGSARILTRDQIWSRLRGDPRLRGAQIPEQIVVVNAGYSVDRSALRAVVADYLRQRGWTENQLPSADSLRWSDGVRTGERSPRLEITRLDWSPVQPALQLRVRCAAAAACGSFLVRADSPMPFLPPNRSGPAKVIPSTPPVMRKSARALIVMPAGKRALLILETAGMRISLSVIPLERGAVGQQIRAREWHGHQVYRGQVVGPGLLRAAL